MYVSFSLSLHWHMLCANDSMYLTLAIILAGPCASFNIWAIHCNKCCHIWSPLLPIMHLSLDHQLHGILPCTFGPLVPIITGPSIV